MGAGEQFTINTIYVAGVDNVKPSGRLRVLSVVTLIVAFAWLNVTWERMYPWAQETLALGELNIVSGMMSPRPVPTVKNASKPRPNEKKSKTNSKNADREKDRTKKADARRKRAEQKEAAIRKQREAKAAQVVLASATYGWLVMLTVIGFILTAAGCAGLGSVALLRRLAAVVLPVCVLAGAAVIWYVWKEYGWYEVGLPDWVRPVTVGLGLGVFGSIGFMMNGYGRGMHLFAGVSVIGSALLSIAALWIAVRWGQMPSDQLTIMVCLQVFGIQSAYGWFLLLALRFA